MENEVVGLLDIETESIKKLEKNWITDFFEIGKVLSRVNENKLYKSKYDTFESYIEDNFSFKHDHAYNFIKIYEKYSQNVELFNKTKKYGVTFVLASLKIEDNYVEELIEKVETKKIDKEHLISEVKRLKTAAGTKPSYSNEPSECILKLKRQFDILMTAQANLKIAFENWKMEAKRFKDDELDEMRVKAEKVVNFQYF